MAIDDGGPATTPAMPGHRIRSVTVEGPHTWTVLPVYAGVPEKKPVGGDVVRIDQHVAQGEGDRWYYDVVFHGGDVTRLFDVIEVTFVPKQETEPCPPSKQ